MKKTLQRHSEPQSCVRSTPRVKDDIFGFGDSCSHSELMLFERLRENVPVIDACISKIIRLTGDFSLECDDEKIQEKLDRFVNNVRVGATGQSLFSFVDCYLDSLLTYGNAVGEILIDADTRQIAGLYNADSTLISVKSGNSPLDRRFVIGTGGKSVTIEHPERILYTALNPTPKYPQGVSILRGLPGISSVLLRIYECIGQNFDRIGNVRYAVTYKPSDSSDKAFAKERAQQIASEWSDGMNASKNGEIKDFIAVGDIGIKVIGAENQTIDTDIPVRQLLEQIVAKLSIPPFLLGLSWSTTERMSKQQCDMLTSELDFYRRLLTPVILRIADTFVSLDGSGTAVRVVWHNINLQDECELAEARLSNARAAALEEKSALRGKE